MDPQVRKKALRMISYGVYILTSKAENEVAGCTVTWVSQASMNPPMIMVGLEKESHTYQVVQKSGKFVVHFLGQGQKEIAQKFFKPGVFEDGKIHGFACRTGVTGVPILVDVPAYIECRALETVGQGDHHVVVAEVIGAGVQHNLPPLSLRETGWSYGG
ncbi:MAG: flavin reductase [Chlamydiae bacterium]|nr:flavin reductase [Chlamydiota bacterium]MBI3276973.1 flavin reductase [Chlamydiota bacterium]